MRQVVHPDTDDLARTRHDRLEANIVDIDRSRCVGGGLLENAGRQGTLQVRKSRGERVVDGTKDAPVYRPVPGAIVMDKTRKNHGRPNLER